MTTTVQVSEATFRKLLAVVAEAYYYSGEMCDGVDVDGEDERNYSEVVLRQACEELVDILEAEGLLNPELLSADDVGNFRRGGYSPAHDWKD